MSLLTIGLTPAPAHRDYDSDLVFIDDSAEPHHESIVSFIKDALLVKFFACDTMRHVIQYKMFFL